MEPAAHHRTAVERAVHPLYRRLHPCRRRAGPRQHPALALPYADRWLPSASFDMRQALAIHAQGIERAVRNDRGFHCATRPIRSRPNCSSCSTPATGSASPGHCLGPPHGPPQDLRMRRCWRRHWATRRAYIALVMADRSGHAPWRAAHARGTAQPIKRHHAPHQRSPDRPCPGCCC